MRNYLESLVANSNYSDLVAFICVPLIVGILAIAFPILSGQKNKINTKYASEEIAYLFKKDTYNRLFEKSLITSLILLGLFVFQIPSIDTRIDVLSIILDYSAVGLLFVTTSILIVSLFKLKEVIEIYESPLLLLNYCKKRYRANKSEKWLVPISHILHVSIKNDDENIANEAISFISSELSEVVKVNNNNEIEFPPILLEIIDKANTLIHQRSKKPYSMFNGSLMLNMVIANGFNGFISEKTYHTIWAELVKAVFYKNDNMIYSYWGFAHQYMTYQFSDYGNTHFDSGLIDEETISKHKEKFKEFHYMLGALLLYSKRYELLGRVFYFTQTMPATYKLVPNYMEELLYDYKEVKDDWSEPMHYRQKYYFPDNSGVNGNGILVMWLEKYFAILFLRQYNIYSTYQSPPYGLSENNLPRLPESVSELDYFKGRIERLNIFVESYLTGEYKVVEALEFNDFLNKETYEERKQKEPKELLTGYISYIDDNIKEVKVTRKVTLENETKFKEMTLRILKNKIRRFTPLLFDGEVKETNLSHGSSIGYTQTMIMDKGAWTGDVQHLNYDSILAESIVQEMEYLFSMSFVSLKIKKIYKLAGINIFDAIKRLKIENKEKYVIANIGFHIEYYSGLEQHKGEFDIGESNVHKFIDFELVDIGWLGFPIIGQSLFLLKRADLPELRKHNLSSEILDKYELEPIGEENDKLYASVVDLNKNTTLKEQVAEKYRGSENLEESVAVYIGLQYELRWPKEASCIQIKSEQDADSLDDINPSQIEGFFV